jgi:hypothetical protein
MSSAFLVSDLIGRNAGLELKCNARGFIHPELNDAASYIRAEYCFGATGLS